MSRGSSQGWADAGRRPSVGPGSGWLGRTVGLVAVAALLACTGGPGPARDADDAERLRGARQAQQEGRIGDALDELDYVSSLVPDYVGALRSDLLLANGDPTKALIAAEQALSLDPPSELRARLHSRIARLELERGEVPAAYQSARQAWEATRNSNEAASSAVEFAQELEQRGFPGEALILYRQVWERWPGSDRTGLAFERSRALTASLRADEPQVDSLLATGERLHALFRCSDVVAFFQAALARRDLDAATLRRARRGEADCSFQQRRYAEALVQYGALAREDPSDLDVAILAARSRGRGGDNKRAVRELEKLARTAPRATQPRIKNLIATLVGDDDPKREQRLLRELAEQREDQGIAMEARWRLAWHDIGDRKLQSALRWLEPLTRGSKWDAEVQRARYWAAVAREQIDPAEGERELREIAEGLPLTYYGMLAADRLGASGAIERNLMEPPASVSEPRAAQRARLLASVGHEDLAQLELRSWVNQPSLTREDRLIAAQQLHALGNHFAAVQLVVSGFGGTLDEGIDPLWRDAWSSAWPQPFEPLVRAAVTEFDFDEALVYAIMREESLYRRDVESVAGARGLMQLIPPTAKRIAGVLAVPDFNPDALYEPATNVRFGTYYLKELVDEFGGSRPYAIAAYNAGPEAVRKWLGRGGSVPDDRFVDSVPYGETRRYLRRVLRSYRVYQLLYTQSRQHAASQAK